jgi:hypothetical protein
LIQNKKIDENLEWIKWNSLKKSKNVESVEKKKCHDPLDHFTKKKKSHSTVYTCRNMWPL